jgi:hypothetical protein
MVLRIPDSVQLHVGYRRIDDRPVRNTKDSTDVLEELHLTLANDHDNANSGR